MHGIENKSENIDADLIEKLKDNNLGLRHVSFKLSTKEGIINAMIINFHRKNQLRFKLLKGARVED